MSMVMQAPIAQSIVSTAPARTAPAFAAALVALALGLIAPPLALLAVAAAAAHALLRRDGAAIRFTPRALAGPALAAAIVGALWGFDGAMGVLFVWRLTADARWSVAEAARLGAGTDRGAASLHLYATPLLALSVAAYSAPHLLLGLPLDLPHAPPLVPLAFAALAVIAVADWGLNRLTEWRLGGLAPQSSAHALAHHALFLAAYVVSPDISAGLAAFLVWRLMHARGA